MKFQKTMLFAAASATVCACAATPTLADEPKTPGWLTKDFKEFSSLIEGRWDNERHAFFAEAADQDPAGVAPHQHLVLKAVKGEEAEPNSFTSKDTYGGDDAPELSHHLSIGEDAILHTISGVGDKSCQIEWLRRGAQFEGAGTGQNCLSAFGLSEEDEGGVKLSLSDTEFWVSAADPEIVNESRYRRARSFECWTAILRGANHGDSGKGMNDWYFKRGVEIHDQGGVAELETDETPARRVRLRLRDVDWPYGMNRPSLTMYVMEGDDDRAVSYAWAEGGADRIGINLRWLQASCTRVDDE